MSERECQQADNLPSLQAQFGQCIVSLDIKPQITRAIDKRYMGVDTAFYSIESTQYGGRGAFARHSIPKGETILETTGPYGAVIFRKFKREVCGSCFGYAFESKKSKWSVRLVEVEGAVGAGLWFCTKECRDQWISERACNGDITWAVDLYRSLERLVDHMSKTGRKKPKVVTPNPFEYLDNVSQDEITLSFLDASWNLAEDAGDLDAKREWTEELNEFELDTVRYVLDGLVGKVSEHFNATILKKQGPNGAGFWEDFIQLQDNELPFLVTKPYLLASHIKIYRFIRHLCFQLKRTKNVSSESQLPRKQLEMFVKTSAPVRALLSRDPGNIFGIWDMAPEGEESEMLGWGAFTFASYFNHGCAPNVKKRRERQKLVFYTLRDVQEGEELCISYTDETVPVKERQAVLERNWFFRCSCAKCGDEGSAEFVSIRSLFKELFVLEAAVDEPQLLPTPPWPHDGGDYLHLQALPLLHHRFLNTRSESRAAHFDAHLPDDRVLIAPAFIDEA
ncbi:hypothetical protein BJ165DRAFT_1528805 [Panaeolus papilionaceus]|nr:hypothetical protein BJ165DRAFT_1528805 [Panaeolus papilionaceus]